MELFYSKDLHSPVVCYTDADYFFDPHKAISQTGYVFTCNDAVISWWSIKQTLVVISSNHFGI